MRQGLASCHSRLQVRGRLGSAGSGNNETTDLDEERSHLGFLLGVRVLFEEGDGGAMKRIFVSKDIQGCLRLLIHNEGGGTSLEEETDRDDCVLLG